MPLVQLGVHLAGAGQRERRSGIVNDSVVDWIHAASRVTVALAAAHLPDEREVAIERAPTDADAHTSRTTHAALDRRRAVVISTASDAAAP